MSLRRLRGIDGDDAETTGRNEGWPASHGVLGQTFGSQGCKREPPSQVGDGVSTTSEARQRSKAVYRV